MILSCVYIYCLCAWRKCCNLIVTLAIAMHCLSRACGIRVRAYLWYAFCLLFAVSVFPGVFCFLPGLPLVLAYGPCPLGHVHYVSLVQVVFTGPWWTSIDRLVPVL